MFVHPDRQARISAPTYGHDPTINTGQFGQTPSFVDTTQHVAMHYDQRPAESLLQRSQNPVLRLKNFNNLMKRTMIAETIDKCAHIVNQQDDKLLTVVDLGGGKAGDLKKYLHWCKQYGWKIDYTLFDISQEELERAKARVEKLPKDLSQCIEWFAVQCCDMTNFAQTAGLDSFQHLEKRAHIVSCQFCVHYMGQNDETLSQFFDMAQWFCRRDGKLLLSYPQRERVMAWTRFNANNSICQIEFDTNNTDNDISAPKSEQQQNAYKFTLAGAVHQCREYLLPPRARFHQLLLRSGFKGECQLCVDQVLQPTSDLPLTSSAAKASLMELQMSPLDHQEFHVACLYEYATFAPIFVSLMDAPCEEPQSITIDCSDNSNQRKRKHQEISASSLPKKPQNTVTANSETKTRRTSARLRNKNVKK